VLIEHPTGSTIADYAVLRATGVRGPDGLSIFKPPYSRITAIDMNTGEHLWMIPTGETPDILLDHPDLKDKDIPNTGVMIPAPVVVTKTLLMYTSERSDGTPALFAVDKATGKQVGVVEMEGETRYGNMTYVHKGRQYVILQTGPTLTAWRCRAWARCRRCCTDMEVSRCAVTSLVLAALGASPALADGQLTTETGVYTKSQAKSGEDLFEEHCLLCHDDKYFRPVLKRYNGQPVSVLFDVMAGSMPESNPGGLLDGEYVDIMAYIFSRSRYPEGDEPMAMEDLPSITIEDP